MNMQEETKCKDKVRDAYRARMGEVTRLWELYKQDQEASDPDIGRWTEYGLSFDYVPMGTFIDQRRGYFRYQLSWGGPSEEFRFFSDETLGIVRVEFWHLDWFDGACVRVTGKALATWKEIWEDWQECDLQSSKMKEAE